MKNLLFAAVMLFISICSFAQTSVYVNGCTRSNGTNIQGHYRTSPNSTRNDNWSTLGNSNPYTGIAGTKQGDSYFQISIPSYPNNSYSTPSHSSVSLGYYSTPTYSTSTYYSTPTYSTYSVPTYSSSSSLSSSNYTNYSYYSYSRY